MSDNQSLLTEYVETGSETAFRELVSSYVDLVYSAAVRLVNNDTHLAEDVTQTVFADLARLARTLPREAMLGGWLHRHTCFVASKMMRGERRRRDRERQAMAMNFDEDHSPANLAKVAPALDDAINQLGAEDRAAILLRFFEQQDYQSVGEALGSTEEAARKRVDRAVEKLHGLLTRRGIALSATALAATLTTGAVSAAPVGLAVSVSSAALAGAAITTGGTLTFLQIMSMTKLKIAIVSTVVAAGIAIPLVLQQRTQNKLNAANDALRQQLQRANQLANENEVLLKQIAANATKPAGSNNASMELLRLRSEVGRLRNENATVLASKSNAPSALSGIKANPEMWKMIRDQQKLGISMIYGDLTKKMKLEKEQKEKLNDVLTDHVMENIDKITEILAAKKSPEEANLIFNAQEAQLNEKIKAMLGDEGYAQYADYTKNLASYITAYQFKDMMMTGEKEEKEVRAKQFYKILQDETQSTLSNAGLPDDYQLVPTLNFRNFVSESTADQNLKLLEGIYDRALAKSGSVLTPEDIKKFGEFRELAINRNRAGLAMNRQLMSPGSK